MPQAKHRITGEVVNYVRHCASIDPHVHILAGNGIELPGMGISFEKFDAEYEHEGGEHSGMISPYGVGSPKTRDDFHLAFINGDSYKMTHNVPIDEALLVDFNMVDFKK